MRWLSSLILALFGMYLLWTASPKNKQRQQQNTPVQEQPAAAPTLKSDEIEQQHQVPNKKLEQKIPTHSSGNQDLNQGQNHGLKQNPTQQLKQNRESMELLSQMSTKTQAQNSLRDLHEAADSILKSAVLLGDYKEKWKQDPSLRPQALGFYQNCASNSQMAKSLRATCWSNAVALSSELKASLNDSGLTRDIKELAKHLSQNQN